MGRFKIYDPITLVDVGKDKNYGRCLQCHKNLKNIMGNIKRHYEQVHNKYFSQAKTFPRKRKNKKKIAKKLDNQIDDECQRPKSKLDTIVEDVYNTPSSSTRQSNRISEQTHKMQNEQEKHTTATPKPNKRKRNDENDTQLDSIPIAQQNHTSYSEQIKKIQIVSLAMDKEEYLKCIAETITELNMPLRYFDDKKSFQKLLHPWTKAYGIQFNSKSMCEHINNMSNKLRREITKIVGTRYICLKLDIVSKMDRSIMVLNIQFIKDFEMNVFTIGVMELSDDHYASYLKQQIMITLERFQLDIGQVHSITKDYGSNVKQSYKTLQEFYENDISADENDNYAIFNEYSQNLSESFVAHALHFVACDIIKQLNENISQSRDAVKSIQKKMQELNINPIPVLDNAVRWSSTYDMINSLLSIRQYVEHNEQLEVEVDWEFARKFEESFKPVVDSTTFLQSNQLIMGDLYREWLVCETELEELSNRNELALFLLDGMRHQKKKLMENESFLAALYLDPRFCYNGSTYLTDEQMKTAIFQLLLIFNKLKSSVKNDEQDASSSCTALVLYSVDDRYGKLEKKAAENRDISKRVKIEPRTFSYEEKASISEVECGWVEESLEQLKYEEKLTFSTNILYYWKAKSYKNIILAKIAEMALAVPATQVTIKRAFSALPLMLTKHKRNLSLENLENILLLKLNPELVKKMSLE